MGLFVSSRGEYGGYSAFRVKLLSMQRYIRAEMYQTPDFEYEQAWYAASDLRRDLVMGRPLPTLAPRSVRMFQGESLYADSLLHHDVYCGMDVTYQQSTYIAFGSPLFLAAGLAASMVGNSIRRQRAERMAMEQWRPLGPSPTLVTSRRFLAFSQNKWFSWPLQAVVELWPAPHHYACVVLMNGESPLRISGPWAAWHCVVLAHLLYGPAYLAEHPEFQQMGRLASPSRHPGHLGHAEGRQGQGERGYS